MPQDSSPAAVPAPDISLPPPPTPPGLLELFIAFAKMSLAGFGGVLVWARRGIVDQHRWMTAEEFNETFALCHFLPGPNIVNLSVVFGSRFRGIAGGAAAFAGLARSAGGDRDYSTLVWTFALMSLFAIGGANLAIPENASARGRRSALDERPAIRRYLFPSFPRDRMC